MPNIIQIANTNPNSSNQAFGFEFDTLEDYLFFKSYPSDEAISEISEILDFSITKSTTYYQHLITLFDNIYDIE